MSEWIVLLAASSGAPEGLGACGHKPAFNLWLQEGMTLLSAGRGPAQHRPVKDDTVKTGPLRSSAEQLQLQMQMSTNAVTKQNGKDDTFIKVGTAWSVITTYTN